MSKTDAIPLFVEFPWLPGRIRRQAMNKHLSQVVGERMKH